MKDSPLRLAAVLSDEASIARRLIVHGRVQGVGFRYFVQRQAQALGVGGSVRNRADGTVEIYAVGGEQALAKFNRLLRSGPPLARVDRVEDREAAAVDARGFQIEY